MQEVEGQAWGLLLWGLLVMGVPIVLSRLFGARYRKHPVPIPVQNDQSVRQALGAKRCDLCKRGCTLIAPKCQRGRDLRDAMAKTRPPE
jgi:hypothetical protein